MSIDFMVAVPSETEGHLDSIARPFGGHSDGWGTFGNGDDS